MEHGVAFIEPAGLRVDEVRKRPAWKGCGAIGNSLGVEMIDGGGAFRIEQRSFGRNIYGRA